MPVLRRNPEIPANKAMQFYFTGSGEKFRGRPVTTLPVTLNNDLKRMHNNNIQLTSANDLQNIQNMAADRKQWRKLCTHIRKAAEAAKSDD